MKSIVLLFATMLMLFSCEEKQPKRTIPVITEEEVREPMVKYNKQMIQMEDQQIDDYLLRRGWVFQRTQTGLRYHITEDGYGVKGETGMGVVLEYSLSLIRGEKIYTSEEKGPIRFIVDKSEAVSGLNEVVKYLKVGDRAIVIVPSYLGYGLPGDGQKIPRKSTLIYTLYFKEARG